MFVCEQTFVGIYVITDINMLLSSGNPIWHMKIFNYSIKDCEHSCENKISGAFDVFTDLICKIVCSSKLEQRCVNYFLGVSVTVERNIFF